METKKYFGEWTSYKDFTEGWNGAESVKEDEVVFAGYFAESYEGSATCYYVRDGKLYGVYESHCSCNGLDTFKPELTSPEAVLMEGHYGTEDDWKLAIKERFSNG